MKHGGLDARHSLPCDLLTELLSIGQYKHQEIHSQTNRDAPYAEYQLRAKIEE